MTREILLPRNLAVLFDVDGTLCDTDPLHFQAYNMALNRLIGMQLRWDEYVEHRMRRGAKIEDIVKSKGWTVNPSQLFSLKTELFSELADGRIRLRDGVADTLAFLRREGIAIGLVSNARRGSLEVILRNCWQGAPPDVVITMEDVAGLTKPNPTPYLIAAETLGHKPDQCLVFEDTPAGVRAAKAAGMACIALQTGVVAVADLAEGDAIIGSFNCLEFSVRGSHIVASIKS